MKAKIAYLTSPAPNTYVLNIQVEGREDLERFEISKAHLTNIIIDGTSWALRESIHRVPESSQVTQAG